MFYFTNGEITICSFKLTGCQAKLNYSSYCLIELAQLAKFELPFDLGKNSTRVVGSLTITTRTGVVDDGFFSRFFTHKNLFLSFLHGSKMPTCL